MEENQFKEIQKVANGMLALKVYQKIYEQAKNADEGIIIEVGTAHGAATIALALGVLDSGKKSKIYTFEKIIGGSRERYGTIEQNIKIIQHNFKTFGVDKIINLIIDDVQNAYSKITQEPISLLMLDADGSIDRDLSYFYNNLKNNSPIIIDDCNDYVKLKYGDSNVINVDLKHKLTYHLVDFFIQEGILQQQKMIGNTFFGKKPSDVKNKINFADLDIIQVYRELVFTQGQLPSTKIAKKSWKTRILKGLKKVFKSN